MTYDPKSLPETPAVLAAIDLLEASPALPAVGKTARDTLGHVLALCLVRDAALALDASRWRVAMVERLATPWRELGRRGVVSMRTGNCMENAGYACPAEVVGKTDGELLRIKNFGRTCLHEVRALLAACEGATEGEIAEAVRRGVSDAG